MAGNVEAGDRHHAAGHIFVAAGDGDQAVHTLAEGDQFDGVGDDFAADQGGFHSLGAHGDAVADGDGAELERYAVGGADAFLDALGEAVEVDVAGGDVAGEVGDGDEGFFHILLGDAHRHKHSAGGGALGVVGDFGAAVLVGGGGGVIGGRHGVISGGVGWAAPGRGAGVCQWRNYRLRDRAAQGGAGAGWGTAAGGYRRQGAGEQGIAGSGCVREANVAETIVRI